MAYKKPKPAAPATKPVGKFAELEKLVEQNKDHDFKTLALHEPSVVETLNWKGMSAGREETLKQLKTYQRLLRIMPDGHHAIVMALMDEGFNSALQVASVPKNDFLTKNLHLFNGDKILAENFYKNALVMRRQLLLRHMNNLQKS